MTGEKLTILFNPSAGKGRALKMKTRLESCLRNHGLSFELFLTGSEDELKKLAAELSLSGRIIVGAGGDSTIHLIVNEMLRAGSGARLGIIPLGSSNDIALEFGLDSLESSCLALKSGRSRRIDVGCIVRGGERLRFFLGQANIGLGALVNRHVEGLSRTSPLLGRRQSLAGLLGILRFLNSGELPYSLSVASADGIIRGEFIIALFNNIRYWATGKMIIPAARPDDGRLDACLIEPCSFARLVRLVSLAGQGRMSAAKEARFLRAETFEIASEKLFDIQTDGEILGDPDNPQKFDRIRLTILPRALEMIV